jgi:hypothetical protein
MYLDAVDFNGVSSNVSGPFSLLKPYKYHVLILGYRLPWTVMEPQVVR